MAAPDHPIDIVDRIKPQNLHGVTWHHHADAMLDTISRLCTERDNALDHLLEVIEAHPELADDEDFVLACLALL